MTNGTSKDRQISQICDSISSSQINSGEYVSLCVIEIVGIPDETIIRSPNSDALSVLADHRKKYSVLLSQLFQGYSSNIVAGTASDFSLELTWLSQDVVNQSYFADLRVFLVIRSINEINELSKKNVAEAASLISTELDTQRYEYSFQNYDSYSLAMSSISYSNPKALVKLPRVENLQNGIVGGCYVYDLFPLVEQNMNGIVDILINNPHSSISFHLSPTSFSIREREEIEKNVHVLDNLCKGINSYEGNITYSLAENCSKVYRYYNDHKMGALFQYNIFVNGPDASSSNIASAVFGQIAAHGDMSATMSVINLNSSDFNHIDHFSFPWILDLEIASYVNQMTPKNYGACSRLSRIISADEASEFFRLPIGGEWIAAGLKIIKSEKKKKTFMDNIINGGDISVGILKNSSNEDRIGFYLSDITKHMLITGTPGSGKTTFSIGLLDRLWREHKIPFLIIEPAKSEYRALIDTIPDMQVFTPGKNFLSPFVFNPFVVPKGVKLESYKSTLKTALEASVSMASPLDFIFEQSVNNCYSDYGWTDSYSSGDGGDLFNISDFILCFRQTFEQIGYVGDARNIGLAGEVRLKGLIKLFDTYSSIPIEDLLSKPTLIELSAIENYREKSLVISLILLNILAYVNANCSSGRPLRNVILLEEAHVLLGADVRAVEGEANPGLVAKDLFKRMLAEIRAFGIGIIVADQSPRKVSADIVGLTNIKLTFRLVETEDKETISNSTNMEELHFKRLSCLRPGEAFLFFDRMDEPEEITTENYREKNKIFFTISDAELSTRLRYWSDKKRSMRPYPECDCSTCCELDCDYNIRVFSREVARRIFLKYVGYKSLDFETLKRAYSGFKEKVISESNLDCIPDRFYFCVKVQFLRHVRYESKIKLSEKMIKNTLKQDKGVKHDDIEEKSE